MLNIISLSFFSVRAPAPSTPIPVHAPRAPGRTHHDLFERILWRRRTLRDAFREYRAQQKQAKCLSLVEASCVCPTGVERATYVFTRALVLQGKGDSLLNQILYGVNSRTRGCENRKPNTEELARSRGRVIEYWH